MIDVSGNDDRIDQEPTETTETNSSDSEDNETTEQTQSVVYVENSIDYTGYFENLQTIGIFISALLVAYGLAFAFFKGFKR